MLGEDGLAVRVPAVLVEELGSILKTSQTSLAPVPGELDTLL